MDTSPITARSLQKPYHIRADEFGAYKDLLSDFRSWKHILHARQWLIFPRNIGPNLSIDETALSNGNLYTIVSNKDAHGGKGALVAIVSGTKVEDVVAALMRIHWYLRCKVREVTMDFSEGMHQIVLQSFPFASITLNRFHMQQLATDSMQELCLKIIYICARVYTRVGVRTRERGVREKKVRTLFGRYKFYPYLCGMIEMSATQALMELTTVLRNDYITKVTDIRTTSISLRCSAMKQGKNPPFPLRAGTAQRIREGKKVFSRTLRDLADYIPPSHNLDNAEEVRDQLKEILRVVKGGMIHALLGYDTKRWSERVSLTLRKGRNFKSYFFTPEELEKIRDFLYSTADGYDMWYVLDDGN